MRCPVCKAKPKEKCTLSTGQECVKTHLDRGLAATKAGRRPENSVEATLRVVKAAASRGFHNIFHHT